MITIVDAINSLVKNAKFIIEGDDFDSIIWIDNSIEKPLKEDVLKKFDELKKQWDSLEYSRLRQSEYPDFNEYLDGVVKGDQDQINSYIAKCLAVKEKYPKPV